MFDHLANRFHFWYYKAPPNRQHTPRIVESHIEEIEVLVSGRGYFEIESKCIDAGPGSALWYRPGDCVDVRAHETDPYETIVFRFEVKRQPALPPPRYSVWLDTNECIRFCRYALALSKQSDAPAPYTAFCYYARLFWEAMEYNRHIQEHTLPLAVKQAVHFIETHCLDEVTVSTIASSANVSASHLHLLFRKHMGVSPIQAVIRQRLIKARDLLMFTGRSVKEICYAVGFHDLKYFCSRFKRDTGLTPTEYRRRFELMT